MNKFAIEIYVAALALSSIVPSLKNLQHEENPNCADNDYL